ncbi:MAG: penicillin-binding protein 2 [Gemmatimonadales bacterium]|jgi:penicillin-binding protein 2|nr:MAG: penicillin-binding protein 2 [Gemmatimonadales bacterium]
MNNYHPLERKSRGRVALAVLGGLMAVLGATFFRLQVLRATDYAMTAEDNRLRRIDLPAPRGTIYDRNGRIVAENVPGYAVTLLPAPLDSLESSLGKLAPIMEFTDEDVERLMDRARRERGLPLMVDGDASFEKVSQLEERSSDFPRLVIDLRPRRQYYGGSAVGHVTGYIGEITEEELDSEEFSDRIRYDQGVVVGKTGVEKQYEATLQGTPGTRYVEVDARGRIVGNFFGTDDNIPARPGQAIQLALDLELQEFIHEIFPDSLSGAVVALDPADGSVLALYSAPSFDPNEFVGGISPARWRELNDPDLTPLYNRAVLGRFAPASTWKLASAAIALDLGVVQPDERMDVPCTGAFTYGNRTARCWNRDGHGDVTLLEAVQHSCDVYFYQLGLRVGLQRLLDEATEIGFSRECGIDLPQENPGIFPRGPEYWERVWGYTPREGEVLNLAIGQGPNQQTPLKMAQFYAAIARDGSAPAPRLFTQGPAPEGWELNLSPEALETMREGLRRVTAPGGTAYLSSLEYWDLMGKTGTGQNPLSVRGLAEDHAWFAGMAGPRGQTPEIVVVVLVEYGGGGSAVAAPIMAKAADFYLRRKYDIEISPVQTLREHLMVGPWPAWAPTLPPARNPVTPRPPAPRTDTATASPERQPGGGYR